MNCPYCHFKFNVLAANMDLSTTKNLPPLVPCVCEQCAQICLIDHGEPRKASEQEVEALKLSPSWKFISRAIEIIEHVNKSARAKYN